MSIPAGGHNPDFVRLAEEARGRIQEISVDEYRAHAERGDAGQLVDVRDESEYREGHAAGAINLSRGTIERDIAMHFPEKDTPLVLYCGGGYRSALATDNIRRMGYTNAVSLAGGWRAIEPSGIPLEMPQDHRSDRESFSFPGIRYEILSSAPELAVLEITLDPEGEIPVPERQHGIASYYGLLGSVAIDGDGSPSELKEGGYLLLRNKHTIRNHGHKSARVLLTLLPGNLEEFRIR